MISINEACLKQNWADWFVVVEYNPIVCQCNGWVSEEKWVNYKENIISISWFGKKEMW